MSHFRQAMLSLYWFGCEALWGAVLITTLPSQALAIGGDEMKGRVLGTVLLVGAFASMVVAPVFGAVSDRITTRFGQRRPWIVLGTAMTLLGLYGLAHFPRARTIVHRCCLSSWRSSGLNSGTTSPRRPTRPSSPTSSQRISAAARRVGMG